MSFVPLNQAAQHDLEMLADWQQDLVLGGLLRIREQPMAGILLTPRRRFDSLVGCRSFHIRGNPDDYDDIDAELRIVYRELEHDVEVIAIGRRAESEVYLLAQARMETE